MGSSPVEFHEIEFNQNLLFLSHVSNVKYRGGSRIRPLGGLRGAVREREITDVRESCWQQAQVGQLGLLLLLY